jgi:hypothetical protein
MSDHRPCECGCIPSTVIMEKEHGHFRIYRLPSEKTPCFSGEMNRVMLDAIRTKLMIRI